MLFACRCGRNTWFHIRTLDWGYLNGGFSTEPHLFPHKLSMWTPCGTVLTGGMNRDLRLSQQSGDCNLPHMTATPIFCPRGTTRTTYFEGFGRSFAVLLLCSLWGKHHCISFLNFSVEESMMLFWLAEVLGDWQPQAHRTWVYTKQKWSWPSRVLA